MSCVSSVSCIGDLISFDPDHGGADDAHGDDNGNITLAITTAI